MSKPLFYNVGKDIKAVAKAEYTRIFAFYILIGIVIILIGCAFLSRELSMGWYAFPIAFCVMYYGHLVAKLRIMLVYAYGEMAECLVSIDQKLSSKNSRKKVNLIPDPAPGPAPGPVNSIPWEVNILR